MADQALLRIRGLETWYGRVPVLRGVDLDVHRGQIVALLGANGAGKTTLLRTISGIIRSAKGEVEIDSRQILGMDGADIVALGVTQAPEGREVFPHLTVEQNLRMGAYTRRDTAEIARDIELYYSYFPILRERAGGLAMLLSGGQQQMLAIARAMMARPKILLLDEPSLGLSPLLTREIWKILLRLNEERNTTILLVEQNVNLALQIAHHAYVLDLGRVGLEGPAAELRNTDAIRKLYLGAHAG